MVFDDSNSFRPGCSETSWPKLLEGKDPLHLSVFNESCEGRTTIYDIGELNSLSVMNKKFIPHELLDYVIVMLGTNDVKNRYGPLSPAEIAEGMNQILETVDNHKGGAKRILLTPPPLGDVISGDLAGAYPRVSSVVAEYHLLAMNRDVQLIDIHSILKIRKDLEFDMIHLNAVGRKKVANAVWTNIQGVNPYNEQAEVSYK
jgi:lysophospholipase L1-like esterase